MKKLFLCLLLSLTYNAYCQTKDTDPTILEKLFSQEHNLKDKITQEREGSIRELTQIGTEKKEGFKKYLLTERNLKDETPINTYIVSKKAIEPDYDLYKIKTGSNMIINFDKQNDNTNETKGSGKITVKWNDKEYDMNQPFSKLPINTEISTEICVDHWWVTYIEETGEILSVEYMGSDCYVVGPAPSTGGGGSTNPPPVNSCNLTCEETENILKSITGVELTENISYETGALLSSNGKIRKPLNPRQQLVRLKFINYFEPEYSAYFKGIVYKDSPADPDWKWESCMYDYSGLSDGIVPPCFDITYNVNVSECVITADKKDALTNISFQFKTTFTCMGTVHFSTYTGAPRTYHFYSYMAW